MKTIHLTRAEFDALPDYSNEAPCEIPYGFLWKQEARVLMVRGGGVRYAWVLCERLPDGSYADWRIINTD